MNIEKCLTCTHYEPFFCSCTLYTQEVYLGEGDWDVLPVSIKGVNEEECEYESI